VVSPTRTRRSIIVVLDGVTEKLAETWLSPETRNVSPLKSSKARRPPARVPRQTWPAPAGVKVVDTRKSSSPWRSTRLAQGTSTTSYTGMTRRSWTVSSPGVGGVRATNATPAPITSPKIATFARRLDMPPIPEAEATDAAGDPSRAR